MLISHLSSSCAGTAQTHTFFMCVQIRFFVCVERENLTHEYRVCTVRWCVRTFPAVCVREVCACMIFFLLLNLSRNFGIIWGPSEM